MKMKKEFYRSVLRIAVPVALQSMLQSSLSVVDQFMIGQLGDASIAGVGLGGKFASLYHVVLGAVTTAAGIMIAQYMGQKDDREVSRSFFANGGIAVGLSVAFFAVCMVFSHQVMGFYTKDADTRMWAENYLRIYACSFLPMAVGNMTAVLLRCMEAAALPLYAGIVSVFVNTGLNYLLIFGKGGFPEMGVRGAALATVISQTAACVLMVLFFFWRYGKQELKLSFLWRFNGDRKRQYLAILLPLLICEFLWSLGENVYAAIYGNMGTGECAAMTLTVPVQTLLIGALSGLSQAAGILIGKTLGSGDYDRADEEARQLMVLGAVGSLVLSILLAVCADFYVGVFRVEPEVRAMARKLLLVFALVSPVKVQNMILGGGIIRSGGRTKYVMWIDFLGTWLVGVPLGLLAAFVWHMSIPWVYFMLSLEECVRLAVSGAVFKKGVWRNLL